MKVMCKEQKPLKCFKVHLLDCIFVHRWQVKIISNGLFCASHPASKSPTKLNGPFGSLLFATLKFYQCKDRYANMKALHKYGDLQCLKLSNFIFIKYFNCHISFNHRCICDPAVCYEAQQHLRLHFKPGKHKTKQHLHKAQHKAQHNVARRSSTCHSTSPSSLVLPSASSQRIPPPQMSVSGLQGSNSS